MNRTVCFVLILAVALTTGCWGRILRGSQKIAPNGKLSAHLVSGQDVMGERCWYLVTKPGGNLDLEPSEKKELCARLAGDARTRY